VESPAVARKRLDPTRLEVFRHYLIGAAEEVWGTVRRAAYSLTIKERGDCSSAIFDRAGNLLAIPMNGVPLHQGSLEALVHEVLARYPRESIDRGDMFITNDPYTGGTHTPDYCVVAPVFAGEGIVAFVANVGHHSDVGGVVACSISADVQSIFEEGVLVPPVRLCKGGAVVDEVFRIICHNSRMPFDRQGDLRAQISANLIGIRRIEEIVEDFGVEEFLDYAEFLLDYSYRRALSLLEELPDGAWEAVDFLDGDGAGSGPVELRLAMKKRGDSLVLDWTGMPAQLKGGRNVPYTTMRATCFCVLRGLLEPTMQLNGGFYRAVDYLVNEASFVNPRHPAPVGDRATSAQVLADLVAGCVSQMDPSRGLAATGCFQAWAFEGFDPRTEQSFAIYESIAGGLGATHSADGIDAVRGWPLGSMNAPLEAFEQDVPVVFRDYSLLPDSGGAGQFQGGLGMRRDIEIVGDDLLMTTYTMRQVVPAPGLLGGERGAPASFVINPGTQEEKKLPAVVRNYPLKRGDIVSCRTPGGGGFGSPAGRDGRLIERDLLDERISLAFAERFYPHYFRDGGKHE
jgi:N-methylhydantoinase B